MGVTLLGPNKGDHRRNKRGRAYRSALLGLAALILVGGCEARIDQRGNKPDEDQVVQITPGVDDKNRVAELLGYPSTISTFSDKTWYYISKRTKTIAFWQPDLLEQEVLQIHFDDQGIVQNMRVYTEKDGQQIAYVDRVTPTPGNELTLIQQLLGNLGKFNSDKFKKVGVPGS